MDGEDWRDFVSKGNNNNNNNNIALLVPVYNGEHYLPKFIQHLSLLNGKFDEVLFYNDGSTDQTKEILTRSGFKFLNSKTNNGPGFARNRLSETVSSDFIHFHDVDDEFDLDFIRLVDDNITKNNPDVIFGNSDWLSSDSREIVIKWRYNEKEMQADRANYFLAHPLGIINTVYRRSVFTKIGGFYEQITCWEDADLHIRLAIEDIRFSYINKVIAYSLRHERGISKNQQRCWHCRLKFLNGYLENYGQILDKTILSREVKNVQNAFVNMGAYSSLREIFKTNRKFRLDNSMFKIKIIYYLNKYLIPSRYLKKMLTRV